MNRALRLTQGRGSMTLGLWPEILLARTETLEESRFAGEKANEGGVWILF